MGNSINQSPPILSVIMPVYNAERYLSVAIESILNQSFNDFEFIIINDGSTDNSSNLIKEFALKDNRIVYIERDNKGLVYSLNEGLTIARGIYIARMDSDDISHCSRFEKQISRLESASADICGSHYFIISQNGKKISTILCPLSTESTLLHLMGAYVPFAHGSVMFRKFFLDEHKLKYTNEILAEDYNLWLKFFELGAGFDNIDDVLFSYRIHSTSISNINNIALNASSKKLSKEFIINKVETCQKTIGELIHSELSDVEEQAIMVASYRLLCVKFTKYNLLLFTRAFKRIPVKSKFLFLLKFVSGRL